jgi:hypothetical protein
VQNERERHLPSSRAHTLSPPTYSDFCSAPEGNCCDIVGQMKGCHEISLATPMHHLSQHYMCVGEESEAAVVLRSQLVRSDELRHLKTTAPSYTDEAVLISPQPCTTGGVLVLQLSPACSFFTRLDANISPASQPRCRTLPPSPSIEEITMMKSAINRHPD